MAEYNRILCKPYITGHDPLGQDPFPPINTEYVNNGDRDHRIMDNLKNANEVQVGGKHVAIGVPDCAALRWYYLLPHALLSGLHHELRVQHYLIAKELSKQHGKTEGQA